MAHQRIALLALLLLPFLASAQVPSTDTKDYQTARKRLYIGTDTSLYYTSMSHIINASSTYRQATDAKTVYDFVTGDRINIIAGSGISKTGTWPNITIANTGDLSTTNEIQDLSLSGQTLSLTSDASPVTLPVVGILAGTGIGISSASGVFTITNSGDTNASDDITTSTTLGGDLSGTLPNPTVIRLQGRSVANTAPSTGEILKWNGSAWAPGTDAGASMSGHTLKDDGVSMTARTGANFISTSQINAALTDDAVGDETEIRFTILGDAITATEIAADAVGASEIAADAVGSSEIATDAVGSAEISANAVSSSELASTSVTAGSYGSATQVPSFTVDADGRLTAASNVSITGTLPSGTSGQTLRHNGSAWIANSFLYNSGTRIGVGTVSPKGNFSVYSASGDITIGKSEIMFSGPGVGNNTVRNNNGGERGLFVGNTDCCDTLGSPFVAAVKLGGATESEFFQPLKTAAFQMTTGAATGRVLQSNSTGNASWVDQWTKDGAVSGLWTNVSTVTVGGTSGSKLFIRNNDSGTGLASTSEYDPLRLRPLAATSGNWAAIAGYSFNNGISADIAFQFVDHTSHYANISFATRSSGGYNQKMVILNTGEIGIGTSSPSQKLHVSGNARITGALFDGTNSAGSSGNLLTSTGGATAWASVASILSGAGALTTSTNFAGDVSGVYNNIQIGADAVGSVEIATGAVTASELASTAVTAGTYGSATQVPVIVVDADGRITSASNTTITDNDTNIGNTNLTLSGNRTLNFNNNNLEYTTGTGTYTLSTSSTSATYFQYKIGQGAKLRMYDAAGTTLISQEYYTGSAHIIESSTRQQTIQGATSVNLLATDGVKSGLFTVNENNYVTLPSYGTFPTVTGGNKIGWNTTTNRITYAVGGVETTVASYDQDIRGVAISVQTANFNLGADGRIMQIVDANSGSITVTLGTDMVEGVEYVLKCRRNATNTVTFSAGGSCTFDIDTSSSLTPTSLVVGSSGTGIQAPYKVYHIRRNGNNIFIQ